MDKSTYFQLALKAKAYENKEWILSILSVIVDGAPQTDGRFSQVDQKDYPYRIYHHIDDDKLYFINEEMNGMLFIELSDKRKALFNTNDLIELGPGILPNQKAAVKTCVGNAVVNGMILCYPFGDKIPYLNKRFGGYVDRMVAKNLAKSKDDPDPTKITVPELLRYHEAIGMLEGLTQITSPTITEKAILPNPRVVQRVKELYEEHKDRLQDPVVQTMIKKEIEKIDREDLKDDPSANFYPSKYYGVNRMKMLGTYGAEAGFGELGDEQPLIQKPLSEGIDLDNIPALFDNIRSASASRGILTALGGAGMKYISRVFQNSIIEQEDCGTKGGMRKTIHPLYMNDLVSRYAFDDTGKTFVLTADWLKQNIGKTIVVRSPQFCNNPHPSYCLKCLDENKEILKTGLYLIPMDVFSVTQNNDMKAMHGREMKAVEIDLNLAILGE